MYFRESTCLRFGVGEMSIVKFTLHITLEGQEGEYHSLPSVFYDDHNEEPVLYLLQWR